MRVRAVSTAIFGHGLALLKALRNRDLEPIRRTLHRFVRIYKDNRSFRDRRRRSFAPFVIATKSVLHLSPRILFYPDPLRDAAAVSKICRHSGYIVTNSPDSPVDLAIKWWDTTFSPRDRVLASLSDRLRVLNLDCEDISKTRVNAVFSTVFGYTSAIDPLTFTGECVEKSDMNALHNGRILRCPIPSRGPASVYQRIIDNEVGGGLVEDIRVPVFGTSIPFVYLKYRPVTDRFGNTNARVVLAEINDVLTLQEVDKVIRFCELMSLDYGELDILRDRGDGLIYIVDVNSTPWGPPNHLAEDQARVAIARMAKAFSETFL